MWAMPLHGQSYTGMERRQLRLRLQAAPAAASQWLPCTLVPWKCERTTKGVLEAGSLTAAHASTGPPRPLRTQHSLNRTSVLEVVGSAHGQSDTGMERLQRVACL